MNWGTRRLPEFIHSLGVLDVFVADLGADRIRVVDDDHLVDQSIRAEFKHIDAFELHLGTVFQHPVVDEISGQAWIAFDAGADVDRPDRALSRRAGHLVEEGGQLHPAKKRRIDPRIRTKQRADSRDIAALQFPQVGANLRGEECYIAVENGRAYCFTYSRQRAQNPGIRVLDDVLSRLVRS